MGLARAYFAVQAVAGAAWWVGVFILPALRAATLGNLDPVAVAVVDVPLFVFASAIAALGVRWAAAVSAGWTVLVALALAGYSTVTTEAGWGVLVMAGAAAGGVVAACVMLLGRVPTAWMLVGPFAFRAAPPRRSTPANVASTFGQIAVFWGFFLVVVPVVIAYLEQRWSVAVAFPPVVAVAGVVLLGLASALGIWSAVAMSTLGGGTPLPAAMANRLVILGPYRVIRNPMAVAGFVQGAAVGLIVSSWLVVVYGVLGSLVWNYAIRPHEEADLQRRFGDDFVRYRDRVRCWLPGRPIARS